MDNPSVFIGSSREGLDVAHAVEFKLQHDAEITLWNEGVFGLSQGTLESLVKALDRFDFAILVLTPDDLITATAKFHLHAQNDYVKTAYFCRSFSPCRWNFAPAV